jgi:hypothetical protein
MSHSRSEAKLGLECTQSNVLALDFLESKGGEDSGLGHG